MKKKLTIATMVVLAVTGASRAQETLMDVTDLYMVGGPTSWNALELLKTSDHKFYYEGNLPADDGNKQGCFRASAWGADVVFYGPQVHAVADMTPLNEANPEQEIDYNNMEGGDKNWRITEAGYYRVIFDLENAKISIAKDCSQVLPVIAKTVYAIGDATLGGWDAENRTPLVKEGSDPYTFTYQAYLKGGKTFKFSLDKLSDPRQWDGFWIHPAEEGVTVGTEGLTGCRMRVFRGSDLNDYQWKVETPGTYKITLNLRDMTMNAEYLGEKHIADQLWLVGDVTDWNFQPMEKVEPNVFEYTCGNLEAGKRFRASMAPVWGDHFRPEVDNTELAIDNKTGLDIKTDQTEDYNWTTKEPGTYKLRFNLNTMKVSANNDNPSTSVTIVANDDDPERYYNLQGVPVDHITAGGIYIHKKGTVVKKVIVR